MIEILWKNRRIAGGQVLKLQLSDQPPPKITASGQLSK